MTENTNHERDTPHRQQTLAKIPVLCLHLLVLLPHQIFVSVVAPGAPWILLKMLLICKEIKLPAPPLSCRNSTQISTRIQMVVTPSYSVNSLTSHYSSSQFDVVYTKVSGSNLLKASLNIKHCTAGFWSATSNICFSAQLIYVVDKKFTNSNIIQRKGSGCIYFSVNESQFEKSSLKW